jgi:hypothetical protein
MSLFDHKLSLSELLRQIPEDVFKQLSQETKVDYYTKVLYGKVLFYLLLYGLLKEDRLGRRGIADLYASPHFGTLFNLPPEKKRISHSSLSERLSVVKTCYFEKLYAAIYARFSALYPAQKIGGLTLQRVDSSLVREASNKLKEGLNRDNGNAKGKMIKYTMNYDGM